MRKLLVASQKGGVGKTTSSINFAAATAMAGARVLLLDADPLSSISSSLRLQEHPYRLSLRQTGVELPGVLSCNVIPGLDVLSPYDEGGCTDDELTRLLQFLAIPAFAQTYACLVVDTPPFLGANPGPLLATCDEFILIMRAEPLAYRTLPAFLELVQRSRGQAMKMRGILLTLPEGETPGCRWERELRGRFGTRVLSQVIPHDEEVSRSAIFGQIVCHAHCESPAAAQYHGVVEALALATDAAEAPAKITTETALLLTTASLKNAATSLKHIPEKPAPGLSKPNLSLPSAELPLPEPTPPRPMRVPAEPPPEAPTPPRRPAAPAVRGSRRVPVVPAVAKPSAVPSRRPTPSPIPQPAGKGPGNVSTALGLLWFGLAIIIGVSLRFLKLPDFMLPVLVGFGVAAVVIVGVHCLQGDGNPPPVRKRKRGLSSQVKRLNENLPRRRPGVPTRPDVSEN